MSIKLRIDTAISMPLNIKPLLDDTDFKTIKDAIVYNAAEMNGTFVSILLTNPDCISQTINISTITR